MNLTRIAQVVTFRRTMFDIIEHGSRVKKPGNPADRPAALSAVGRKEV